VATVIRDIYFPKLYDSFSQDLKDYLIELERRLQRDVLRPEGDSSSPIVVGSTSVRRAKIISVGTSTLTCKLLDSVGSVTGDNITVNPVEHLGSNNLSGNVWPDLATNDIISIFKDKDNSWYTTFIFDDICLWD